MGSGAIKFFLSYSITHAPRPDAVRTFIEILKDVITKDLKLEYSDPFENSLSQTIASQVTTSLGECDCLIAETTSASSNVWFEMGFAESLGKPFILFLDKLRSEQNISDIDKTLADVRGHLLGQSDLPADIGERKYSEYELPPGHTGTHIVAVRETIKRVLSETCDRLLRTQVLMPRRSVTSAFQKGLTETKNFANMPHKLWILDGLAGYLLQQYEAVGSACVQIDETIYQSMLRAMSNSTLRASARAVADLGCGFEPYMLKSKIEDVKVKERIFVFNNFDAFTFSLERVADDIWRHALEYKVHVIDKQFVQEITASLDLKRLIRTGSVDVMTTGQAALWYSYSDDEDRTTQKRLLTIDHDRQLVRKIETLLDQIRDSAVDVSELAKANPNARSESERFKLIKAAWLKKRSIGQWGVDWRGGSKRSYRYYKDYETHIRVWIPEYRKMADILIDHVMDAVNDSAESFPISMAEVGPGTGELTERLLGRLIQKSCDNNLTLVSDYRLYESAPEMLNKMASRGLITQSGSRWVERRFQPDYHTNHFIHVHPYNVNFVSELTRSDNSTIVIGSLVHHYIDVLDRENPDFSAFLQELELHMTKVRHVVFSGVFYRHDRHIQEADWREWMTETACLDPDAVDRFFKGNTEMLRPFVVEEIQHQAETVGWDAHFTPTHSHCPFGVMHFEKTT